ncbi:MAG: alternate-type signal peptide domain-containing protein [Acidimicrobiales bacterium]
MNKTTKGAIASGVAALLLLGGGTSLAYWTATGSINGGTVTAGELALSTASCDTNWVYAPGQASAGSTVTLWVPGDVITKNCTFTVTATGDNLLATLTTPTTVTIDTGSTTTGTATVAVAYLLGGAAIVDQDGTLAGTQITESATDRVLSAQFTVTFPFGTASTVNANDTQGWVATLNALTVTLTQENPNP